MSRIDRMTSREFTEMMETRDQLRSVLVASLDKHGRSEEGMAMVYRDLRMKAEARAARCNVFHVDEDEIRQLERLGQLDYADKFSLYVAWRMWGVR